jgi:hypothetical protein
MNFADNHLSINPGLCPSSIVPFPFINSIFNPVLKIITANLYHVVAAAGYGSQLSTHSLHIYL